MEKTVDLKSPELMDLGREELKKVDGGKPISYHISYAICNWMLELEKCGMETIPF